MVAGAVLAGGASRRMGVDKARLPLDGLPLAEHMAQRLRAAGISPCVLVRRGPPDGLPWKTPCIRDAPGSSSHPLSGAVAALDWSPEGVVLVATDLVHLAVADMRILAQNPGASLWWQDRHVMAVHLAAQDRDPLTQAVASGSAVGAWLSSRPRLEATRDPGNLNRPEDFAPFDPARALSEALGLTGEEAARLRRGERQRLRSRGCLLPPA